MYQFLKPHSTCSEQFYHFAIYSHWTYQHTVFLLDMYTDYNAGVIEKIKAQRTSLGDLLFFSLFLEPALIAKSSLLLDVKPWDDETDMKKMEEEVRKITADGLLWGQGQWDMLYNSYIFGAEF